MTAAVYSYSTSSVGHFSPPLLSFGFPFATFSQIVLHNLANWQHLAARGAKTISLGSQLTAKLQLVKVLLLTRPTRKKRATEKQAKRSAHVCTHTGTGTIFEDRLNDKLGTVFCGGGGGGETGKQNTHKHTLCNNTQQQQKRVKKVKKHIILLSIEHSKNRKLVSQPWKHQNLIASL